MVVAHGVHPVPHAQLHAAVLQLLGRVLPVLLAELLEQRGAALDQRDLQGARVHLRVEDVQLLLAEVGERAGDLHPGGAAADDGDVQLVARGVAGGALQLGEHPLADGQRLGAGVHRHRVLLGAGGAEEVGGRAVGQHQVVVGQVVRAALALVEGDDLRLRVHAHHLALAVAHVGHLQRQPPQEHGDVPGVQAGRGHLVQQRLEGLVDVAVDQGDPHPGVAQPHHGLGSREAAADDHDVRPALAVGGGDGGSTVQERHHHEGDSFGGRRASTRRGPRRAAPSPGEGRRGAERTVEPHRGAGHPSAGGRCRWYRIGRDGPRVRAPMWGSRRVGESIADRRGPLVPSRGQE